MPVVKSALHSYCEKTLQKQRSITYHTLQFAKKKTQHFTLTGLNIIHNNAPEMAMHRQHPINRCQSASISDHPPVSDQVTVGCAFLPVHST